MPQTNLPFDAHPQTPGAHPMLDLLEQAEAKQSLERGDVLTGIIAMIGEHELLIDVGAKSEGVLAAREFAQLSPEQRRGLAIGDAVEVIVVNPQDRQGNLIVSLAQAQLGQDWEDSDRLFNDGTVFEAMVSGHNKGGLIVYVGQVRGFVPTSQIDRRHAVDRSRIDGTADSPLAALVGDSVWVKIIEIDRRRNRLILSEQAAMRERRKQSKADLLDTLEIGREVEGRVTSLADFGAFVDVGGADGLVHLSELSWNRVSHPREVLELGQTVRVKVIAVDRDRKRIGLSLKQLQPEPWTNMAERFDLGKVVRGTITRLTDYGAFARLEGDIEGLIHVSELSDDGREPGEAVSIGDSLELRVIRIDPERKRIGLSLKRAGADYDELTTPEALADLERSIEGAEDTRGEAAGDLTTG
jgi:small subunit ribosomal protein S1